MLYRFDFYLIIWAATWQNRKCGCAPSEDSDQPGHPPSLIRVFAVRMKKAWALSYPLSAQRRLWSDWANAQPDWSDWVDAQPDLSLRWAHTHFVGFVMSQLMYSVSLSTPTYLPSYLPTTIYLSIYLSIYLYTCLSLPTYHYLSIYLSIYLSVCLSVCPDRVHLHMQVYRIHVD